MKNTYKFLCLCFLLAGAKSVQAQNKIKLGLDAGFTHSTMNANLSNLVDSKYSSRYGYGVNISGEYLVWKTIFVSTGVSFLKKNYQFERTGSHQGWYTKYNNSMLTVPLLVGGYLINNPYQDKGVWVKVAAGMYVQHWLSMKRDGQYPIFAGSSSENGEYQKTSDTYNFKKNENQFNRFGYGAQGQVQLGYSFKKFDIYAAYNYQYSFSDIQKNNTNNNQRSIVHSQMGSLGISYKFN